MPNNNRAANIRYIDSYFEMFQNGESSLQIDYCFEEKRIQSFATWPVHFPVDPIRLAKAGFYYSGNEDEVICFSCHGHVKDWNYGDIVQKKHSDLFPDCDFVNGRSKNVPITQTKSEKQSHCHLKQKTTLSENSAKLTEIIKTINYSKMKFKNERLRSFEKNWPNCSIDILKLVEAGFFHLGIDDKVQCPYCKGIVSNWEDNDDPLEEHRKHFPWCDYLSNDKKDLTLDTIPWFQTNSEDLCGNMQPLIINESSVKSKLLDKDQEHVNLKELGVHLYNSPAHPQQASFNARLRSFISWPSTSPISKEDLAKAGFFYIGIGDHTKCFHCNGGLCNWEIGDDPWVEHAKWFCNCNFLRLNKGDEFVEACLKDCTMKNVKENILDHTSTLFCSEPLMAKVDEAMKSDMVKYCLDSGLFPHYIVRVAVMRQIEETGSNFQDMNELCLAVTYLKEEMEKMPIKREEAVGLDITNIDIRKCIIDDSKKETFVGTSVEDSMGNPCNDVTITASLSKKDKHEKKIVKTKSTEDQCLCKICMDKEVGVVFLPCGHLLTCTECAPAMELCPMCRKPIQATIRAYLP